MLCSACKRTQCTYRKEEGFATVFLTVYAVAPCKPLYKVLNKWLSEFITAITYSSESLYILGALNTLFSSYVRYIGLQYYYSSYMCIALKSVIQ